MTIEEFDTFMYVKLRSISESKKNKDNVIFEFAVCSPNGTTHVNPLTFSFRRGKDHKLNQAKVGEIYRFNLGPNEPTKPQPQAIRKIKPLKDDDYKPPPF